MLFVGDDWAEDHHDVEVVGEDGRPLAVRGVPEGPGGIAALIAAGYEVFAIMSMSVSRYRDRHSTSGAKSDAGDAHVLAGIVRLDRAHHRPVAVDSTLSQAMKVVARSRQSLIWERTRYVLRLRSTLGEHFPAALAAFEDLDSSEALELLAAAPDPDRAARRSKAKIAAALRRAHRRKVAERADVIYSTLRAAALRQPEAIQSAFAVITASEVHMISALTGQIDSLPAPNASCWPDTPATSDSATQCANGHSDRCEDHPEREAITTRCVNGRSDTKPRCGNSATASSASCMAA